MAKTPKAPVAPAPTEAELAAQREAEQAAADARERARVEKATLEDQQRRETIAIGAGLRGRRALLSAAGEVGYSTGLGGV